MTLHPEWRTILLHAWSARLLVLAAVLTGAEFGVQAFVGAGYMSTTLAVAGMFVTAAAFAARLIAQKNYPGSA